MSECAKCGGNHFIRVGDSTELCDECVTPDYDPITRPKHYVNRGGIEPIDFIMSNELGYCEGNVVKYISRYQDKGGVVDLKKARQYIDFLIQAELKKETPL